MVWPKKFRHNMNTEWQNDKNSECSAFFFIFNCRVAKTLGGYMAAEWDKMYVATNYIKVDRSVNRQSTL